MSTTQEMEVGGASRFRKYSPMTSSLAIVVLLAVALLPSALNIPQSNPNEVPEYAPVPPDEDSQTSTEGNLAALGQAGGGSGLAPGLSTPPLLSGTGGGAAQKRTGGKECVGRPPRQTEDPMAPPCVAFFEGNNFGATYQGVTRDEIIVVLYWDSAQAQNAGDAVDDTPPPGSYCDIDLPPNTGGTGCYLNGTQRDASMVRWARAFSTFFNDRYQTYGRRVHFWGYFGGGFTQEAKSAAASEHYAKLKPFAALDQTIFSGNDIVYLDAMARRGVMIFRGGTNVPDFQSASFFQKYAPRVWEFAPDIEHWAEHYVTYVCRKVANYPVAHTIGTFRDQTPMRGAARKYGFLSTASTAYPGFQRFAKVVKSELAKRCQVQGIEEFYDFNPDTAARIVTRMQNENVTTILSLGGSDLFVGHSADQIRYYPEILFAGDQEMETNAWARVNNNSNWMRNSWVVTNAPRYESVEGDPRYAACIEGDPSLSKSSCSFGSQFQRDYFMLFGAIQAAGPRLTPRAVDRGFHALPAIRSTSPSVPTCFFDPGDYTCVKDGMHQWWDPGARASTNQPGCWKMLKDAERYLAHQWEAGDQEFPNSTDRCNAYGDGRGGVFEPQ